MARMVKPVVALVAFALWAALPLGAIAEEKQGGENASERSPEATARGTTYNDGPKNVFGGGKKEEPKKTEEKAEPKKTEEKAEPEKKAETAEKDKDANKEKEKAEKEKLKAEKEKAKADERARKEEEKKAKKEKERQEKEAKEKAVQGEAAADEGQAAAGRKCGCGKDCGKCKDAKQAAADQGKKNCKCKDGTCAKCKQAAAAATAVVSAEPTAEQKAAEAELARQKARQEERLRVLVKQLGTSGWREAQGELIASGKFAVPILIDSMSLPEADKLQAYNLGGHTKADAGRAPRQRTIAEVCSELLTNMVKNHSNYKGEVPGADQKAWQEWWTANSGTVVFAK